ncbi:unnamed protein product [Anisakis simplex]|uniref:Tight junction protein ZO-1 n=1 Tax=Anisakis simplex TaxID=6269 RepID=A0A158PP22_ANISI|nr:unnamed protein product [Anisakis simplex]
MYKRCSVFTSMCFVVNVPAVGFGIAVSGGRDNPHFTSGDPAVVVSDVVPSGPAWGLVQVNDRILSANGVSLENAEYAAAVKIMKESQQLNMIVKRRAPIPLIEFEQRTLKFTLSKSRKKEDFGIVLGCKYYIKEITNRKLAEKDPGLREGDTVLRINGQSVDGVTIEEATKWLVRSREKLSLVVQRDVRRGSGSRWPSQTTVYERLGSLSATPRHSPSPMLSSHQPLVQRSSADYVNNGIPNTRWPQSEPQSVEYSDYYRRNGSASSSQGYSDSNVRIVSFRKVGGSLGVRVIGGNRVGIFVSAVQEDSPAAQNSVKPGERIVAVNDKSMAGVTREEAVRHLLSLSDNVTIKIEYAPMEFEKIRNGQLGDDFYIRTHFANQKVSNQLELTFHTGDIFHITDTLFGGTVGLWQATRVYSAAESVNSVLREPIKGVIPNAETADKLMRASRAADTSTIGRSTFFRRKLKERRTKSLTKSAVDEVSFNDANCDMPLPAYERVILTQPRFQRPVVLYGPLADIARKKLLEKFALRFASTRDQNIIRLSSIDAVIATKKHCVLDVSPSSVERLQLAQYAPIVILIDVESRTRIRELRAKSAAPSLSSRKLVEQMHKIKKHCSHLLTATLDATKEDGWFDALRQLIAHLQDRRVWMPEFRFSSDPSDVVLLPMQSFQTQSDSDVDSLKGDYSSTDYSTKVHLQNNSDPLAFSDYGGQHMPRALHPARSQPCALMGVNNYSNTAYYQNIPQSHQLPRSEPIVDVQHGDINKPKQNIGASAHSPARRYLLARCCEATVPWATLPRHYNLDQQQHTAATATNQTLHQLTNSSPFPSKALCNYSPTLQKRSTHYYQPQHQLPQYHHCPSPSSANSNNDSLSNQTRPLTTNSLSPVRSPAPSSSLCASSEPSSNRPYSSPTPLTSAFATNAHFADAVPHQADSSSRVFYDMKQEPLGQSSDYYGGSEMTSGQHYRNRQNSPFAHYAAQVQTFNQKPIPQTANDVRCGLFYDHLTRGRRIAGGCNERRTLGSSPIHNQPTTNILRSSPVTSSPLQRDTITDANPLQFVDESPKGQVEYDGMKNGNSDHVSSVDVSNINGEVTNSKLDPSPETTIDSKIVSEKNASYEDVKETTVIEHVSQVVDSSGCTLSCPESGVMLIIPEGAINEGVDGTQYTTTSVQSRVMVGLGRVNELNTSRHGWGDLKLLLLLSVLDSFTVQQEIYVKVCRANCDETRPPLDESLGESLMSPLVMCGPQDLQFNVPVELRLPHSVSNNGENWSFALKSGTGEQWNQVALDDSNSSMVTDKFASVKISHF